MCCRRVGRTRFRVNNTYVALLLERWSLLYKLLPQRHLMHLFFIFIGVEDVALTFWWPGLSVTSSCFVLTLTLHLVGWQVIIIKYFMFSPSSATFHQPPGVIFVSFIRRSWFTRVVLLHIYYAAPCRQLFPSQSYCLIHIIFFRAYAPLCQRYSRVILSSMRRYI